MWAKCQPKDGERDTVRQLMCGQAGAFIEKRKKKRKTEDEV